ncbi:small nuclear ribonucleoprotein [Ordospora colligata]|uniref:Small nuclear ribonucleoprotein n=1 Tax=Ordospora colligata OC4 TaxID=1354746 RepID=A0A0B2UKB3_9MICR|nr:small nuclear ribonucleoprotein [Ordospora colligata OC4]KHN69450.1 small nuclear ribonucleoprotein [Ordospora colligata OC4]TBU15194.1 small nuclear ribonucleoprotein [Ordospora colligata]TBU15265.1 small nuclear ribonucleoprotein [Ordospora colligata]TBU18447.1 small nuclear ribonucleoprotein [Ordospora colligata]
MEVDYSAMYSNFIGKQIKVQICDGSEYKGTSIAIDVYLNISLESAAYYNTANDAVVYYSSLFIKGSYIDHIALENQ